MTHRNVGPPKMWPLQTQAAKDLYEHLRKTKEFGRAPDLELIYNSLRDVEIESSLDVPRLARVPRP